MFVFAHNSRSEMSASLKYLNPLDDELSDDAVKRVPPHQPGRRKIAPAFVRPRDLPLPSDAAGHYVSPFTYRASRHEQGWMLESLAAFYDDNVVTDVLNKVKGGKEATVYCCQAHPSTGAAWLAAKIYRPRKFRNLRNDRMYREGRTILDEDGKALKDHVADRAIHRGTSYGKDLLHVSWLQHEVNALKRLHAAGVAVPKLFASGPNVLIMEFIGDDGRAAPPLSQVSLGPADARRAFDALIDDVRRMLALGVVHGDLSAYNVLYWRGQAKIIDFPQLVDPARNPRAQAIFTRDVARLCEYFARHGVRVDAGALAVDLWQRHAGQPAPDDVAGDEQEVSIIGPADGD